MTANHLQRSGDVMSVSASRAWTGGPDHRLRRPDAAGQDGRWPATAPDLDRSFPDRTTFVGSGTMSKAIACCNDEPGPSFIFDVQLGGHSVKDPAAPRDPARRTSAPDGRT